MDKSVWLNSINMPQFKELKGDRKTDILIIGGGLCGILCAYSLKEMGVDYILAEGSKISSGTTKNTTGKITSAHSLIYDKLLKSSGREYAELYLKANQDAISSYRELCKNIDCDFEDKISYTYSLKDRKKIENEVRAVNSLGYSAEFYDQTELPFKTEGAIGFPNQAQFNPLKFISEISRDLNIYENTFIRYLTPSYAVYDRGKIFAEKIIVATHFPFINRHGAYFAKLYQHRSYVSAFYNAQEIDGMYVDENKNGLSFRSQGDLLLIGGGGHRTGKNGGNWEEIKNFAKKYYPKAEVKFQWAAQDCMSLDSVPYIGQYSKNTQNIYVASGFNKWGMTSSMVAAKILCDMVTEKKNDYAEIFSPQRSVLKSQLFINGAESAVNLLTPTPRRCPHLGCALKWNKAEHSWDCPCHGSRFDGEGKLIDNPAMGDLNKKSTAE